MKWSRKEQKQFVSGVIKNVRFDIMTHRFKHIPVHWEAKQLRKYISYMFERAAWCELTKEELRDYDITLETTDL